RFCPECRRAPDKLLRSLRDLRSDLAQFWHCDKVGRVLTLHQSNVRRYTRPTPLVVPASARMVSVLDNAYSMRSALVAIDSPRSHATLSLSVRRLPNTMTCPVAVVGPTAPVPPPLPRTVMSSRAMLCAICVVHCLSF